MQPTQRIHAKLERLARPGALFARLDAASARLFPPGIARVAAVFRRIEARSSRFVIPTQQGEAPWSK